jgi:hypothetical protein
MSLNTIKTYHINFTAKYKVERELEIWEQLLQALIIPDFLA